MEQTNSGITIKNTDCSISAALAFSSGGDYK